MLLVGDALLPLFRQPQRATSLSLPQWQTVLRQARAAGLLARLEARLRQAGLLEALPAEIRPHLLAARRLVRRQTQAVAWETRLLARQLGGIGLPLVLMKGAAYVMGELPAAEGRLFSDLDILVPKARLDEVEACLRLAGWMSSKEDSYDQRYYRRWMHELPPLKHVRRGTVLDVHHTIVPETARHPVDGALLLAAARPLADWPNVSLPAPADLVVHSAAHLFHEGELDHGLRDLMDLDMLMRHFASQPGFWQALVARAGELNQRRSLFYAVRYCRRYLATPIPDEVVAGLRGSRLATPIMDWLYRHCLAAEHSSAGNGLTPLARWLLYVRGHYLRMPLHLLLPHLLRKAWRRRLYQED